NARGQQLAEVIVEAVVAPEQHYAADLIARVLSRADDLAIDRAGGVLAVEPAVGLDFANSIRPGRQVGELVEAVVVGRAGGDLGAARIEQNHGRAGNWRFAAFADAIVIGVVIDIARDARRQVLAEVVVDAV